MSRISDLTARKEAENAQLREEGKLPAQQSNTPHVDEKLGKSGEETSADEGQGSGNDENANRAAEKLEPPKGANHDNDGPSL